MIHCMCVSITCSTIHGLNSYMKKMHKNEDKRRVEKRGEERRREAKGREGKRKEYERREREERREKRAEIWRRSQKTRA